LSTGVEKIFIFKNLLNRCW